MAYITPMQEISLLIERAAQTAMTLPEIVNEEIKEFIASDHYQVMAKAEEYYRNRSSVQEKTNDVAQRSNTKIEHPILKKLVDQKANYLLSKPFSITSERREYADALGRIMDKTFRRKIKSLGKGAVKSGIAFLQPYIDERGRLRFMRLPSTEIIPLWRDAEHTELDAFIRFYEQTVYEGKKKTTVLRVEYNDKSGVKYFTGKGAGKGLTQETDHGNPENGFTAPHFYYGDNPYTWETAPLIWAKYNEEELPLAYFIRDFIDDINWQTSVTSDVLRDIAKFIYVLRGYGGQDLAEFIKDLRENLAVKVDEDGGVDKLQPDLNIEAIMQFLDKQRRDVYDFAAGVDTKDPDLGNASGTAINFRYMDLDTDCAELGAELQDAFQHMKLFFDVYLQAAGAGDFTGEAFEITFNADMPVNETDIINNVRSSDMLSMDTRLRNHPWVEDVAAELQRILEEKRQNMEKFGIGLFDDDLTTGEGIEDAKPGILGASGAAAGT